MRKRKRWALSRRENSMKEEIDKYINTKRERERKRDGQ